MRTARGLQGELVAGNQFDKYGSRNPVVRGLVHGFDRALFELLAMVGRVDRVLEVGCGEGHVTAKLARYFPGARVVGTDRSSEIISQARQLHGGIEFRMCSIYDVGDTGPWDLVVACEVFEHLEEPERGLDAVCRAASGHVLVTVPREPLWRILNMARGQYLGALGNTPGHLQHWNRGTLMRLLRPRLDVVGTRTPLPWIQVLGRPRRAAAP